MRLDRHFSEFIACCVARDVRFLIVGGYAVEATSATPTTRPRPLTLNPGAARPPSPRAGGRSA